MIEIKLANSSEVTLIDNADFELVSQYKWSLAICDGRKYAYTWKKGLNLYLHKFLLNSEGWNQVDHKDRDGLNNQRNNLRHCTPSQNGANKPARGGSSKYKGVYWDKKRKKWIAGIGHKGTEYYLGAYLEENDAAKRYNQKALELFGEFARINIIEEKDQNQNENC